MRNETGKTIDHDNIDKDKLQREMNEKNANALREEGGVGSLFIFNLENFAYRYFETGEVIKCQVDEDDFYVEFFEPSVVKALKNKDRDVKDGLIAVAKEYSGMRANDIRVRYRIGSKILSNSSALMYAEINWGYPEFKKGNEKIISEEFTYDDPIELRNKHAAILEKVCELF